MFTSYRVLALALALSALTAASSAQVPDLAPAPGQPAPAEKPISAKPEPRSKPEPKLSRRQLKAQQQQQQASAAAAPTPDAPPADFPKQYIHSITFKGGEPYAAPELLTLSGLKSGQLLAPDSLQAAVQRLSDSGLFTDAQASNNGDTGMRDIVITLKPTPDADLLRVSFANFIWLSDRDLQASIRRLVPIFHTGLPDPRISPVAKSIADDMQANLVKLMQSRGVVATIAWQIVDPNQFHPYRSVEFRITDPNIHLDSADITNYPNSLITAVANAVARAKASTYNEGIAGVTIEDLLLSPARDFGYVNARLDREQRFHHTMGHEVTVQYAAQLNVGPLFHIRSIHFDSTPNYDSSDYGRDRKVQPGDTATTAALEAARKPILDAYLAQGYLEAYVDTKMVFDEAHGVLDLKLSVIPGPIYRIGKLDVIGLSPAARAEFDRAWKLNPGVVYSDRYVNTFAANNPTLTHLNAYTYSYQVSGNSTTHTADLTLTFRPRTGK